MDVYVKYDNGGNDWQGKDLEEDGSSEVSNKGLIAAIDPAWFELGDLAKYGENGWDDHAKKKNYWVNPTDIPNGCTDWEQKPCGADRGAPGFIAKIFTVKAWQGNDFHRNMGLANDSINKMIYEKIENPGKYFAVGKRTEYFGYPMDAYSNATHKRLDEEGIPMARGGAKSGVPMFGDFFHPYAIDFDAFYIDKNNWTPESKGAGFVYPDNAHVRLGLNEMIDQIISTNGYMIREFHAVADIANGAWYDNGPNNYWPINSSGAGKGGWWGGITKNQLEVHYNYLKGKIDANDLVVYTASEAVKYRLTANAVSSASLNNNILSATTDGNKCAEKYRDEISVIVQFNADVLDVEYENGGNPRLAPKKLANNVWAVNFNPFKGSVRLIAGQDFNEPEWDGPDTEIEGGCDDPFDPACSGNSISSNISKKAGVLAFTGIKNGQISLRLTKGNYTAELYNLQGRLISSVNINAVDGVNATGLKTNNLAKGMLILNVKQKGASVLQHKIMIK
jgi:hypothetical protein